ncbi:TPA: hypothetical protein ACOAY7_002792 [Vibrio cholerae]
MHILQYILILLFTPIRKVVGVFWFWVIAGFRHKATNIVYNYHLSTGKWLKRLEERHPKKVVNGWVLDGKRVGEGLVRFKQISYIQYSFWYWVVWIWCDDDSNYDSTDTTFIKTILDGERKSWVMKFFGERLQSEYQYLLSRKFGNRFELGDKQLGNVSLRKCWLSTTLWLMRNTAYNAKYSMYESDKQHFKFTVGKYRFGWYPENVVNSKQSYTLKFFE